MYFICIIVMTYLYNNDFLCILCYIYNCNDDMFFLFFRGGEYYDGTLDKFLFAVTKQPIPVGKTDDYSV